MKKLYNLIINNKGTVLREDTATTVTTGQIKGLATDAASVFGLVLNTIENIIALVTFFVASALSLFADEETKNRIKQKYEERIKKIKGKYASILDKLETSDSEFAIAMFNPSLAIFEKATEDLKDRGGIIGENLTDFLDDPFSYIVQIYPKIKENITGKIEDKEKEDKKSNADLERILKKIKAIGIENLEPLTKKETSNLNYEQRQALKGILDYFKKNRDSILDNRNYTLHINNRLIIEAEEESENTSKYLDEYLKIVNKLALNKIKQMTKDPELEEDYKDYVKDVNTYVNSFYDASKFCTLMTEFMEKVKSVIDSGNDEGIKQLSNFSSSVEVKNEEIKKKLKDFFNKFSEIETISQLKQSFKNEKFLSSIQQVGEKLQEEMQFLSEDAVKSFTEIKDNIELKEKLEEISKNSPNTVGRLSNLYNYFKQVKLDNDSK